jgi:hypothetical protein
LWIALGGSPSYATAGSTFTTTFAHPGGGLVALVVRGPNGFGLLLRLVWVASSATVPTVQGQSVDQAAAALRSAGLEVGHASTVASLLPAGEVVDTNPPAGAVVAAGTTVDYRVSNGIPVVTTLASGLTLPGSLAVDSHGTIYVALNRSDIAAISSSTSTILTNNGSRVAVDRDDDVFVGQFLGRTIVQTDPTTGAITSFAAGYPGGYLGMPYSPNQDSDSGEAMDFGFDPAGHIVVALYGGNAGRGTITSSIPGSLDLTILDHTGFGAIPGPLDINGPVAVAPASPSSMFFAQDNRILRRDGDVTTAIVGDQAAGNSGDNGPGTSARLNQPTALRLDAAGNVYIADSGNGRVRRWNPTTDRVEAVFGGLGADSIPYLDVTQHHPALAFDRDGNLYVSDTSNGRILKAWVVPPPGE